LNSFPQFPSQEQSRETLAGRKRPWGDKEFFPEKAPVVYHKGKSGVKNEEHDFSAANLQDPPA
jgi:hypothetical protein